MTNVYVVRVDKRVSRELRRLPLIEAERLIAAIKRLAADPRPPGVSKLVDRPGWRIRVGVYRVLYKIDDVAREVYVLKAGHRRFVYN